VHDRPAALHVGIDATSWRNDRGFGRFTRELVTALAARQTFRYTLFFDQPPDMALPAGVEVVSARTDRHLAEAAVGSSSRSLRYLWKMGQLVRRARCDLFFYPAVYSYFPILTATPCVVCYHDTTAERLPHLLFPTRRNHRLWQAKTTLAKLQTTRAMTVSQSSARDLEHILRIPADRIDVVTEAADPVFRILPDGREAHLLMRARHCIPPEASLLIYVGGMNAHKNVLGLLRAMPAVIAAHPETHLAIVGDTSGKGFWDNVPQLREFVRTHPPLQQHVHFTGYLPDEDVVVLMNGAAALVFPSLWEGFGLPAVEAMSCGLPVLASDRGSLPEVIGNAGLFFDPEDPAAIADCLKRFLRDGDLRTRLAAAAPERAREFTWERAAELAEESFRRCARAMHRS
jgi:glycosyltransferase involved in cell wall biosynthesis